jgi:hypothetical protein
MRNLSLSLFAAAGFAATHQTTAHAFDMSGACASSLPSWNAPRGAIVSNRTNGPIRSIIDAVGEQRTHVIMSHGTAGWATHATAAQPSRSGGCEYNPVTPSELGMGYPGFSVTNLGGIYAFIYGSPVFVRYQIPNQASDLSGAQGVADFLWDWSPHDVYPGISDRLAWTWNGSMYFLGDNWGANGTFQNYPYVFFQYRAEGSRLDGSTSGGGSPGVVCSTAIGFAYAKWKQFWNPSFPRPNMPPHEYSKAQTHNAGNALWNNVHNLCLSGLSFTDTSFDWVASCNADDTCWHAAYQVLNCFMFGANVNGSCIDPESTTWPGWVSGTDQTPSRTLSPDGMLGWSGLPLDTSVWAPYGDATVQWSGAGSTYGCWK